MLRKTVFHAENSNRTITQNAGYQASAHLNTSVKDIATLTFLTRECRLVSQYIYLLYI